MAAAEDKNNSADIPMSSGGGGGSNKIVLILSAVNIVAVLAMIGILFVSFQKDRKRPAVEDISATEARHGGGEEKGKEGEGGKEGAHGGGGEAGKKKAADFGKMIALEQFTVNLATPGSATPKFVRVNISLDVPTDDAESEVNVKMPQVRNVIIDLFNSKRPSDLATGEGRDYLKEEIRNAINTFLVTGKVRGVFFTNFALSS